MRARAIDRMEIFDVADVAVNDVRKHPATRAQLRLGGRSRGRKQRIVDNVSLLRVRTRRRRRRIA